MQDSDEERKEEKAKDFWDEITDGNGEEENASDLPSVGESAEADVEPVGDAVSGGNLLE